ncbi:MAG: hypothetical protein EAY75_04115 [Bacteroidetes bacterium]|nr:MAG: hypothetical protein EAY75_04115 [Bacteroidota bacterium]
MKKMFFTAAVILLAQCLVAQSERYTAFMTQHLKQLDTARSVVDYQNVANSFERVANAEKSEWQPFYHAAYALCMKSFELKDKDAVDAVVDKGDALLAVAESLSPNNAEIITLKAMMLTSRMSVDMSRGMTMGPKSAMMLGQALQLQPNNPRALMQMAQNKYYTPEAFGGSQKGGIALLEKCIASYETFKPASAFDPNWGKEYAVSLLQSWKK